MCAECDLELNTIVIQFLKVPDGHVLLDAYRAQAGAELKAELLAQDAGGEV